ncbi:MAG TPA: [FeFe] hydrogenase H-cluster radical SAM maturase HydG, partial [Caldisericia bacterium]|nr:[FeFe] hydrogenase H-cluster radical SAM maturase HydG [Caldisericia bacterium]
MEAGFIREPEIWKTLEESKRPSREAIKETLSKALDLKGLDYKDIAVLSSISDPDLLGELFGTAKKAKETIYGKRLVLFAPLYISNLCTNECLYCAFRAKNTELKRRVLTQEEIAHETRQLIDQG